jgi:hypothetical protein
MGLGFYGEFEGKGARERASALISTPVSGHWDFHPFVP